jgi:DNA-binding NtrC family response regulator
LREHLEDLVLLVRAFLQDQDATEAEKLFTPDVLADMAQHDWPGNVRELRNYVERAVVLRTIDPKSTRGPSLAKTGDSPLHADIEVPFTSAKDALVADFERAYLAALLKWSGGNVSKAARKAGMDRMYLYRLLQRHGLREGGAG